MKQALVLFAHGARDPEWAAPLQRVRTVIQARVPGQEVALAFLEFMDPTLLACTEELVAKGVDRIVIVPMFIAQGGHLKRDLPKMIAELRVGHPRTEFLLASAVGESERVIDAMAETALASLRC